MYFGAAGGALLVVNTTRIYIHQSEFFENTAVLGGAIYAWDSNLIVNLTNFRLNLAAEGSSILLYGSNMLAENCFFQDNKANDGTVTANLLQMKGFNIFKIVSFKNSIFLGNQATNKGGILCIYFPVFAMIENCTFNNNSAFFGGAIYAESIISISKTSFISNNALKSGAALYCNNINHNPKIISIQLENSYCISNSAKDDGGCVNLSNCELSISSVTIRNNRALKGGAVSAINAKIKIQTTATFANNTATESGGAFHLEKSTILIKSLLTFTHNIVTSSYGKGGAIFVLDDRNENSDQNVQCFIGLSEYSNKTSKVLSFERNYASQGPNVYGGLLDRCNISGDYISGIDFIKSISQHSLAITSDPIRVCLCIDMLKLNCTTRHLTFNTMRGGTISFLATIHCKK